MPTLPTNATRASMQTLSAYELPSVEALIRYLRSAAGFPVQDTWIFAIKYGNYSYCTGLTFSNLLNFSIFGRNHHGTSRLI